MNPAIQKTLVFVVLIAVGFLVRRKLRDAKQLGGMKVLILSVALPATIFVALLKIELDPSLLALPLLALLFNGILMAATRAILPVLGYSPDSSQARTFLMLIPSLAPGLSCFPYVLEYLGDEPLAWAAVADLGNKFFVLIVLYLVALRWYHQLQGQYDQAPGQGRLKSLFLSLIREPVNLVIVAGLLLVSLGIHMTTLPAFLQEAIQRLSSMMTPMVLLFIGLAVVIKANELRIICTMLLWRAGIAFIFGGLLVAIWPLSPNILLAVLFPLSACSFWPYAHMCAIQALEEKSNSNQEATFDLNLALAILALSLPFSTALILLVCSFNTYFLEPSNVLITGLTCIFLAALPITIPRLGSKILNKTKEVTA